ncbi:MAG TPA: hypothetical protein VKY90_09640 [Candidatus Dormibacteraeota bacterium]|nr:hypothetical protein [Candidatus Dormibacteraeota bacterium]
MRRMVLILSALVVVGGGWWLVARPAAGPAQVEMTADDARSAEGKIEAIIGARAQAVNSGQPVAVDETFSDGELSWLANQVAEKKGLPVEHVLLHATSDGTIQGEARSQVGGVSVPVRVEGVPEVGPDDRLRVRVTGVQVGVVPVPEVVLGRLAGRVREALELGEPLTGYSQVHLTTTNGAVTVTAVADPN